MPHTPRLTCLSSVRVRSLLPLPLSFNTPSPKLFVFCAGKVICSSLVGAGFWFFLALPNRFAVSSLSFPSFLVLLPLVFFLLLLSSFLPLFFVVSSLLLFLFFPSLFLSPPSRPFFFFFFSLSSSFGTFCGGGWFVD